MCTMRCGLSFVDVKRREIQWMGVHCAHKIILINYTRIVLVQLVKMFCCLCFRFACVLIGLLIQKRVNLWLLRMNLNKRRKKKPTTESVWWWQALVFVPCAWTWCFYRAIESSCGGGSGGGDSVVVDVCYCCSPCETRETMWNP